MESRFRILFLAFFALLSHTTAFATPQVVNPEVERREIDVAAIDTEDFEIGLYGGLLSVEDFGVNSVLGLRFAYHISPAIFVEAAYAQSTTTKTSYERLSGAATLLTDSERELAYYNISFGYNLLPGEAFIGQNRAYNTALYLIAGMGNTRFAGDDYRTINLGAGYRFLLTDSIAFHLNIRDHMFDTDLLGESKRTHNLETSGSITVYF